MSFKMKYTIKKSYLPSGTKRRSGILMPRVGFIVLHDVGNDGLNKTTGRKNGTTAANNVKHYTNTPNVSASAHAFIDDKEILECIPATTGKPEKAWHVLYDRPLDNKLFGDDSNNIAIGTELCYYPEDKARSLEAYKKFVWYNAYLAYYFKLDVNKCFIGHEHLDPGRKSDPSNGIKYVGKKYADLVNDIKAEYKACLGATSTSTVTAKTATTAAASSHIGVVEILVDSLNVRSAASFSATVLKTLKKGTKWKVYSQSNGLYCLGGSQWISAGSSYVKFTKA